mmetsp:Transcript_2766/g.10645  ORF Transcript_2766/g.10645 Transcript_2766/m.10645 type:complete len:1026 (-) Transcript_2766:53-3130(-)
MIFQPEINRTLLLIPKSSEPFSCTAFHWTGQPTIICISSTLNEKRAAFRCWWIAGCQCEGHKQELRNSQTFLSQEALSKEEGCSLAVRVLECFYIRNEPSTALMPTSPATAPPLSATVPETVFSLQPSSTMSARLMMHNQENEEEIVTQLEEERDPPTSDPASLQFQLQQNIEHNTYHVSSLRKAIISDHKRRRKLVEIFIYVCFMFIFFIHLLSINRYSVDDANFVNHSVRGGLFNHAKTIERQFSNTTMYYGLDTLQNERDLWSWLADTFCGTMFDETQLEPSADNRWMNSSQKHYMNRYNRILGAIRLQQWRVPAEPCAVRLGASWDQNCYRHYSLNGGDTTAFGTKGQFKHMNCAEVGGPGIGSILGIRKGTKAGVFYDCPGFATFLPFNATPADARSHIQYLKDSGWIDHQTRMIAVEWYTYNPNLNFYSAVQFQFEIYPSGATVPNLMTLTFSLDIYPVFWNRTLTALTYIFVFYYIGLTVLNLGRKLFRTFLVLVKKRSLDDGESLPIVQAFKNFYLYLDIVNLGLFLLSGLMRMILFFHEAHRLDLDAARWPGELTDFSVVYEIEQIITSLNALLLCIRMLKYLRFFRHLDFLERVLIGAIPDLANFALIFLFVFVGFVVCGYVQFGQNVSEFRALDVSFSTMARILLSDVDYNSIKENASLMFSFFFAAFILIAFCYFFNIFLAIMTHKYSKESSNNVDMAPMQLHLFLVYKLRRMVHLLRERRLKCLIVSPRNLANRLTQYKTTHNVHYISAKELRKLFSDAILEIDIDFLLDRYTKSLFFRLDIENQRSKLRITNEALQKRIIDLEFQLHKQTDMLSNILDLLGGNKQGAGNGSKRGGTKSGRAKSRDTSKQQDLELKDIKVHSNSVSLHDASSAGAAGTRPTLNIDPRRRTISSHQKAEAPATPTTSGWTPGTPTTPLTGTAGGAPQHHYPYTPLATPSTPTTNTTPLETPTTPTTSTSHRIYPEEHLNAVQQILTKELSSLDKFKALEAFAKQHGYALKDTREMVHRIKKKR